MVDAVEDQLRAERAASAKLAQEIKDLRAELAEKPKVVEKIVEKVVHKETVVEKASPAFSLPKCGNFQFFDISRLFRSG